MNEFICFPVDFDEKERFQRICQKLNLKPEEWFRLAMIESEVDLAARNQSDPDTDKNLLDAQTQKNHSSSPKKKNDSKNKQSKHSPRSNKQTDDKKQSLDDKQNESDE